MNNYKIPATAEEQAEIARADAELARVRRPSADQLRAQEEAEALAPPVYRHPVIPVIRHHQMLPLAFMLMVQSLLSIQMDNTSCALVSRDMKFQNMPVSQPR